jgi:hypothetical protein
VLKKKFQRGVLVLKKFQRGPDGLITRVIEEPVS